MLSKQTIHLALLSCTLYTHRAAAQAVDTDAIDVTAAPGWSDLSQCTQSCLRCRDTACPDLLGDSLCQTIKCLCRPSYIPDGVEYLQTCVVARCRNLSDAQAAQAVYKGYCAAKGYTSVIEPVTAGQTGTTARTSASPVASTPPTTLTTTLASTTPASSATAATTQSSSGPGPSGGTSSATDTSNSNSGKTPLDPGQIIGIVTAALGLPAACYGLLTFWRKRRMAAPLQDDEQPMRE